MSMSLLEIEFMAYYVSRTLLVFHNKLNLKESIKFRYIETEKYIELPLELGYIIKILKYIEDIVQSIKNLLTKLQRVIVEEVRLSNYEISGIISTSLCGKFLPNHVPLRERKIIHEVEANYFIVTLLSWIISKIVSMKNFLERETLLKYLAYSILVNLNYAYQLCSNLINDPILKPLIPKVRTLKHEGEIDRFARKVRELCIRRIRDYRTYLKVLHLWEKIKTQIAITIKNIQDSEVVKTLHTLELVPSKLYEMFCFTLLLESLINYIQQKLNQEFKAWVEDSIVIFETSRHIITISYNSLVRGVDSKFTRAKAIGIINDYIEEVKLLKGLPDTLLMIHDKASRTRKVVVIDYKYSRDLSYIIQSRFKVMSYLYEHNADIGVLITPFPKYTRREDEEELDHEGFYRIQSLKKLREL